MLGRQAVVDGHHETSADRGQQPAGRVVGVEVADHPTAPVVVDDRRRSPATHAAVADPGVDTHARPEPPVDPNRDGRSVANGWNHPFRHVHVGPDRHHLAGPEGELAPHRDGIERPTPTGRGAPDLCALDHGEEQLRASVEHATVDLDRWTPAKQRLDQTGPREDGRAGLAEERPVLVHSLDPPVVEGRGPATSAPRSGPLPGPLPTAIVSVRRCLRRSRRSRLLGGGGPPADRLALGRVGRFGHRAPSCRADLRRASPAPVSPEDTQPVRR